MKTLTKFVGVALLAMSAAVSAESTDAYADATRAGKNVKYVYQISAQGSHTPKKLLNLTATKEDEPKFADYVTPLGIRQQYMIGDELRYRYVEEQRTQTGGYTFMDKLYNITQLYIQTSWNDTAILSAQAMLLGLYPPGQNNYKLEPSQKYNAVPPIDGFDFTPWIEEMGLEALPFQTTIFPIQMNGWSYDYMLALDDDNCPKRKQQRDAEKSKIDGLIQAEVAKHQLPDNINDQFKADWDGFCDYVSWAYTESVELQDSMQDRAFAACQACRKIQAQQYHLIESELHGLSTQALRTHLKNQTAKWVQRFQVETGQISLNQKDRRKTSLEGTAGTENPQYFMFWTNERLLELISQSLVGDDSSPLPLTPSSTVVIEYYQAQPTAKELTVQIYVNDALQKSTLCGGEESCLASTFQANLDKEIHEQNVTKVCQESK